MLANTGDKAKWARSYTGFLRAFTETILSSALPGNLPQADLVDKIYRQVDQRLTSDPDRYEFHYISVAVLLTRIWGTRLHVIKWP